MDARIISLASYRAARRGAAAVAASEAAVIEGADDIARRFHFWRGASGRRYVHTIYSLLECPALPSGNYILVHRDEIGNRAVLAIGRVSHAAQSLNLAEIRHRGAELGANEVHVHLLAPNAKQARLIETDLRSGHCASYIGDIAASN